MRIEKKSYKVAWRVLNQQAKKYNEDKNNEIARVVLFEQEKKNKYSPYKILYRKRRNKNENRLKIFCTMFTRFIFQRSKPLNTQFQNIEIYVNVCLDDGGSPARWKPIPSIFCLFY